MKAINFMSYYRVGTFQTITSGKREFSKVLIVGQIGIETVLFRTILQYIRDNLYNFVKFDVIQPNGLQCFKLINYLRTRTNLSQIAINFINSFVYDCKSIP